MRILSLFAAFLVCSLAQAQSYSVLSGTVDTDSGSGSTDPAYPTCATGNNVVLVAAARAASETLSTPSGWTLVGSNTTNGSVYVYVNDYVSGDAVPNINFSGSTYNSSVILCFSGDEYTDIATIVSGTPTTSTATSTNFGFPALTPSHNNTMVCGVSKKTKSATSDGQTADALSTWTEITESVPAGTALGLLIECKQQTTATDSGAQSINLSPDGSDESAARSGITFALRTSAAVSPTFTSAPAIGTRTTSAIPINFTSDTTGTVYGARLTDGSSAPTCDQLEAQTATGGLTYFAQAVVATVADSDTFSGLTSGTVVDGYFCIEDGSGNDSEVASIANMYKIPAFTTPLTIASQTTTTYTTNSKVLDGAGVVDLVVCAKDATPPSVSQVIARTGGCIINGVTDDATGTMNLSPSGTLFPLYDLYYTGSYGGQVEAAVNALPDEFLDPATDWQFITLTSVGAGSPVESFNTAVNPDLVAGDILVAPTATSPGLYTLTIGADGQFSYTGDGSRQLALNIQAYDVSASGYHASDIDFVANDPPVECSAPVTVVLVVNSTMSSIDLDSLCLHPLGDILTYALTAGVHPTGVTLTTDSIGGTPTVEDESGELLTYTSTNPYGGSDTQDITLYPIITWTITDCTTAPLDVGTCVSGISNLTLDSVSVASTYTCDELISPNLVISQSPTAGAQVAPFTNVDLVVSRLCANGGERRLRIGLGLGL